jgi:hypothetical protein
MMRKCGSEHASLHGSCAFSAEIWELLGEIAMEKISVQDAVQVRLPA